MWEEFFPHGRIYEIDIDPRCHEYQTDRTKVFIGDQCDRLFLQQVIRDIDNPLDFVIDDGGHKMIQHQIAIEELFPAVRPGGRYAIEDLLTAYRREYGGGY